MFAKLIMAKRAKKHINYLRFLAECTPAQRKSLLEKSNSDQIKSVCDCVENLMSGNVKITPAQKRKLKSHVNVLRELRTKIPLSKKKKLLIQKGGALPFLIPALAALGGFLASKSL
jgi:hypothetical protein